jgi:hypothetical protein
LSDPEPPEPQARPRRAIDGATIVGFICAAVLGLLIALNANC